MGVTVRQKKPGRGNAWWVFIHTNGRLRSKKIGDRRAAEAVASELRKQIKAGELQLPSVKNKDTTPTFDAYADHYLNDYAKVALKWSTWNGYRQTLRDHILPTLGKHKLNQISRRDIKKLLLEKADAGLAPGTIQNIQVLISGIFTHAYEDEIITAHPALKMGRYIRKSDRRANVHPITADQVRALLATCRDDFADWYPLVLTAFRTGMRLGELLGLAWEDVDFEAKRIEVRRSYSHSRFSTPKSHKSRVIDMSDQLAQTLLQHRGKLIAWYGRLLDHEARLPRGKVQKIQMVFCNRYGGPVDGDLFRRRVFRGLLEGAGLPHMRIHDIRHTFASLLLQNGESLHYVKEQMGHASIQTTVDVYGHMVPGSNRNAVNRLDDPVTDDPKIALAG